jgi:glycerol-3-phosphate dehydrogenase (NAD(P)+)
MLISILGAGSWGSALAVAVSNVANVRLWSYSLDQVDEMIKTSHNTAYLPSDVRFSDNVSFTNDIKDACYQADLIVIATPVASFREILIKIKNSCDHDNIPDIIWVCKGFEVGSGLLPHQVIGEVLGEFHNYGALLGPTFAHEVAISLPTAITLASLSSEFSKKWIKLLKGIPNFRIYANNDLIGAEVGSAVKNIIAIAAGVGDGLQLGLNARAALITRSLHEISELIKKLGGNVDTLYGLTGIGDIILTCTGDLSRNRTVGLELSKGYNIDTVLANLGHVAEGVYATKEVYLLAKRYQVSMPIVEAVYGVIYENKNVKDSVLGLLSREPKFE